MKFVVMPLVALGPGLLVGLNHVADGLPMRVLMVQASMPIAFNALIPPTLFGLNEDLANTAWMLTIGTLVVIVPLQAYLLL
jgi:predicted permease